MSEMIVKDLGLMDYQACWQMQLTAFNDMVERKRSRMPIEKEYLFLVEHPPVVTLGRHAHKENMLFDEEYLKSRNVGCFRIERGGDVTFHGPGQLVAYPLLDLEKHHLGVKDYVNLLEEAVMRTLAHYGIIGERVEGASGVWIGKGTAQERKICAVGVKCSRFCTMHGLALNVNTDLNGFKLINPCGFIDKGVTSMKKETGHDLEFQEVKTRFSEIFLDLLI